MPGDGKLGGRVQHDRYFRDCEESIYLRKEPCRRAVVRKIEICDRRRSGASIFREPLESGSKTALLSALLWRST
jgi:hypothetical protein